MLKYIGTDYRNPEEHKLNLPLINREYEKSLDKYVVDCFKSISLVLPEVTMVDHRFIIDVHKVNQSDYERTRSNKTKDINQKYTFIKDSRLGELTMKFAVDMEWEGKHTPLHYDVKMLIPIPDSKGYYYIKGNKYLLQYQLTESATYTTSTALVTKSLMPIKMKKRKFSYHDDASNVDYHLNFIQVEVFDRYRSVIYFYLATMGWSNTLEFFSVGEYISAVKEIPEFREPGYEYIKVSSTFYIKVLEKALMNDYCQTILGCLLEVMSNRVSYNDLMDKDFWVKKIGAFKLNAAKETHYELGKRYIILFNRMIDEATMSSLRLTEYNKESIYCIVRWMLQNYTVLWKKDNNDIVNKRLRSNEYAASLLNQIISEKIKKFVNTIPNTEEKMKIKYDNFFAYKGSEIIFKLHSSGLFRCDENVNDMDMFAKLKITQKGPNASGSKGNSKTISSRRRILHPSHLGRQDVNVCSASEPGLTNYITPLCETDGMYFKGAPPEPETFYVNFKKAMGSYDEEGNPVLEGNPIYIEDYTKFNNILHTLSDCHIVTVRKGEQYQ